MTIALDPLPPREAIAALARRGARLEESFAWQDVWQETHGEMFTVAKSAGFDILSDIYAAVQKALAEGKTFRDFAKVLTPVLQAKGWWGRKATLDPLTGEPVMAQLGSVRRLQTIFDTNMRVSYAAGHWANFERNKASRPFLRYVAILDERTRPAHAARHNLVLPIDHPYWNAWAPPCGWNCRCTLQSLSQRDIDRMVAEGVPLNFEPPEDTFRDYVNRRSGEVSRVPDGIDPGWAYNPGKRGWLASNPPAPPAPPRRAVGANIVSAHYAPADEHVVSDVLGANSPEEAGEFLKRMVRDVDDEISMRLWTTGSNVKVTFTAPGWFAQRTFSRRRSTGELVVDHDLFSVDEERQGQGLATTILANSIETYIGLDVAKVSVHADIDVGGYTWAKFGFVPSEDSWDELRDELARDARYIGDEVAREYLLKLCRDPGPKTIWELADTAEGKQLLLGTDWYGDLDLRDPLAMHRFNRYVRRSRSKA